MSCVICRVKSIFKMIALRPEAVSTRPGRVCEPAVLKLRKRPPPRRLSSRHPDGPPRLDLQPQPSADLDPPKAEDEPTWGTSTPGPGARRVVNGATSRYSADGRGCRSGGGRRSRHGAVTVRRICGPRRARVEVA